MTISIHALLAESDAVTTLEGGSLRDFYPRSPCGERPTDMTKRLIELRFLSTLSLRRATGRTETIATKICHFYPRSPCGERLHYDNYNLHCVEISIHALLAESDHTCQYFFSNF